MRMDARDRGLRCTTTQPLRNGNRCDNADQLRGRISNKHDDRVRRNVDRWCSEQHERGERLAGRGRRLLKLPQLRRPEFDYLQRASHSLM